MISPLGRPVPRRPAPWAARSAWSFGDPSGVDDLDDLVAIGADLEPGTLLAAYRRGLFPMPVGRRRGDPMYWFCPVRRGVLAARTGCVVVAVAAPVACATSRSAWTPPSTRSSAPAPTRRGTPAGSTTEIRAAYLRLHELGWAHSVEAWRDGRLVGGLYGVAIGGLFAGESMFHRERDASKVALVGLVELPRRRARRRAAARRAVADPPPGVAWASSRLRGRRTCAGCRRCSRLPLPELFARPPMRE